MADAPQSRVPLNPADDSAANGAGALDELRHLILAPELEALERLHHRVASPESRTEDVSTVVAEAIQRRRDAGGDEALSDALAPTIETALRESVRKDPSTMADALFPVMGPAIRRSILETLRSYIESFNKIMDQSLSLQGLKWRLEGLRTGRSFTEVVFLHSLVFRVEQVFLIHKKTGLSLGHIAAPAVAMEDPSLVSGMLSAIQDFVRDSFHTSAGQAIERMNVGDLEVWVEAGPYAILATVIRGVAPRALRDRMAEALENIHREYSGELDRFNGDTAVFTLVNKQLNRCLEMQYKEEAKPKSFAYAWAAMVLIVLVLGGWTGWRVWQKQRWEAVVETLRQQPGLVITSLSREHGKFVIRGLRDPLAVEPSQIVKSAGLKEGDAEFHLGAYYALDDAIVQQRATKMLAPPAGTVLSVTDGVLYLAGQPPVVWLKEMSARALLVPGIRSIDLSGPFSAERVAFDQARDKIQGALIKFSLASAVLSPNALAEIASLLPQLKQVLNAPAELHGKAILEIIGHSDNTGAEATNQTLSQRRAEQVAGELTRLGCSPGSLHVRGVATAEPLQVGDNEFARQLNRSVTIRVQVTPSP